MAWGQLSAAAANLGLLLVECEHLRAGQSHAESPKGQPLLPAPSPPMSPHPHEALNHQMQLLGPAVL